MPIKFHGGKKLSFYELMKKLKGAKDKARLAGWIEHHGPGVYHGRKRHD